jgi:hypothetical protein
MHVNDNDINPTLPGIKLLVFQSIAYCTIGLLIDKSQLLTVPTLSLAITTHFFSHDVLC